MQGPGQIDVVSSATKIKKHETRQLQSKLTTMATLPEKERWFLFPKEVS